jgi:hypothetical protein
MCVSVLLCKNRCALVQTRDSEPTNHGLVWNSSADLAISSTAAMSIQPDFRSNHKRDYSGLERSRCQHDFREASLACGDTRMNQAVHAFRSPIAFAPVPPPISQLRGCSDPDDLCTSIESRTMKLTAHAKKYSRGSFYLPVGGNNACRRTPRFEVRVSRVMRIRHHRKPPAED